MDRAAVIVALQNLKRISQIQVERSIAWTMKTDPFYLQYSGQPFNEKTVEELSKKMSLPEMKSKREEAVEQAVISAHLYLKISYLLAMFTLPKGSIIRTFINGKLKEITETESSPEDDSGKHPVCCSGSTPFGSLIREPAGSTKPVDKIYNLDKGSTGLLVGEGIVELMKKIRTFLFSCATIEAANFLAVKREEARDLPQADREKIVTFDDFLSSGLDWGFIILDPPEGSWFEKKATLRRRQLTERTREVDLKLDDPEEAERFIAGLIASQRWCCQKFVDAMEKALNSILV